MFTKTGGTTSPFKISFIFNPHPDINILVDDPVFTDSSGGIGLGSAITNTIQAITPINSSPTIASTSCPVPVNMLVPDMADYLSNL
jgi:hypothetical protein